MITALIVVISPTAISSPPDYNLPDLGNPADATMSPAEMGKIGAQVVYQLRTHGDIINDPELEAYINRIGRRLVEQTDKSPDRIRYYVINKNEINSFALPGGNIGIFTGVMVATDSESELAGIMAHETAHEAQNHIARQFADRKGDTIATLATALVAGIVGASAGGGGDAAVAAIMGGMSHLGMQQISYTRAHEYEADRVGIRILAAAGYNPDAMAGFFRKLQRNADLYGETPPQILLTHPVASSRIANAESRAAQTAHVNVHESAEYPYMKERARVLQAGNMADLESYYQKRLAGGNTSPADRYGYALTLERTGGSAQATKILSSGANKHPNLLPWTLALASAESDTAHKKQAGTLLADAIKRFPKRDAVKLAYAENLESRNKPAVMRNYLISETALLKQYPEAQRLLARGAGQQHNLGEAYYRQARYFAMVNDYPSAINQLRTALQTAKLSGYNRSRLGALLNQMALDCNRAWSVRQCQRAVASGANN